MAVDGELKQLSEEEDSRLSEPKAAAVKRILEVGMKRISTVTIQ